MIVKSKKNFTINLNASAFSVFRKSAPWATFYTTATTPNPVSVVTRMPVGEKLFFDFGDGLGGKYETVGTDSEQTTSHTYSSPVAGTKITITDNGGNILLLKYFSIDGKRLAGVCPEVAGMSQLHTLWLRNNNLTKLPSSWAGCSSLVYIWLYNNDLVGQVVGLSGNLPNIREIYLDGGSSLSGEIFSFENMPNVDRIYLTGNDLTGFTGSITPAISRTADFKLYAANNLLTTAAVNNILAAGVAAELGTGDVITIDGTGNSAPSGQGMTDKIWLIANGCTVNTN